MAILIDILLISIILYAAWRGYRTGVLKTVIKVGLLIVSVLLAKSLSTVLAPKMAETLPLQGVGTQLASFINTNVEKLENMSLSELLNEWGFPEQAAQSIEEFVGSTASSAGDTINRQLAPAINRLLVEIIVFAFLLIVFWLITILITTLIDNALELPVLGTVNHIAGLAVGVIAGLLILLVITFVVTWSFPLLDASLDLTLTESIVEKSMLIRAFNRINPLLSLLS